VSWKVSDRVTAALIDLHWLPIAERIEYELSTLVYQSIAINLTGSTQSQSL